MYCHQDMAGQPIDLPVGKVVCIGRNYLDHIHELNNPVPEQALLFIKPASALCDMGQPLVIPTDKGECHNELEVAVLIKQRLCRADESAVMDAVWGYGIGLDLTLREMQSGLKAQGHPWERAKAFDFSCPMSGFVAADAIANPDDLSFQLRINGQLRQQGNTAMMMRRLSVLLAEMSACFTLIPGDIVMTGTPKGVGPLYSGDRLTAQLDGHIQLATHVITREDC